jgi:hypothetical protein
MQTKLKVDKAVKAILLVSASFSILIVISIFVFIFRSSLPAFKEFGIQGLLGELTWRPANGMYGILAMVVGSVMVTLMALVLGVPLAIAAAIFLAVIAPRGVQAVVSPGSSIIGRHSFSGLRPFWYGGAGAACAPHPGNGQFRLRFALCRDCFSCHDFAHNHQHFGRCHPGSTALL